MMGLFGTLNLAARSMQAMRTGVEVAGNNLANVNNPAYSRQRVILETSPTINTQLGPEGTGVQVRSIEQIVDSLLNGRIQDQSSISNYWKAQQSSLQDAQNGLNEFLNSTGSTDASTSTSAATNSDSSLSARLAGFFNDFAGLASSDTAGARQQLVSDAQSLADAFNSISTQLGKGRDAANESITKDVASANQLLSDIAKFNKQITIAEASGGNANDLRDLRTQALEKLSSFTDITTSAATNGQVNVSIGGQLLVNGQNVADTLKAVPGGSGNMLVQTTTGAIPITLTGGSIQGTIQARDGTLTNLQTDIDTLANSFITSVNTLHATGFNANGTSGNAFFSGTNAGSIKVNTAISADPSLIQTSASSTATNDNSIAVAIGQLGDVVQASLSGKTFSQSYSKIVGDLGSSLKTVNDHVDNESAVTAMFSAQRASVSGVSLDEEMTTLMSFQRAYTASAQLVKTVDEMLQTTLSIKR